MQCTLLLDIIIRQGTTILQLFASENQPLLIRWNSLFVLNFRFDIIDGIRGFHFKRNSFPRESFDENLHPSTQAKNKMKSGLLLNIIIRQGTSIFELFASKDQTLLIRWDSLFVLNFRFDIVDGIRGLDFKGNGLAREGLDEDLHSAAETKDKVES